MINKQSNTYTLLYIVGMVILVGTLLAVTSMSLKDRQQDNADADKMKQILASVHVSADGADVNSTYNRLITRTPVVNSLGQTIGDDAFSVDVQAQSKIADTAKRQLPVYVCDLGEKGVKYILPVYGAGLWGPIWGYVAIDSDGTTVYGAYFAHQSETPGLGAEIEKPAFSDQFDNLNIFKDDRYLPIAVVKKGQTPPDGEDYVDGISGGTITSKGVSAMLADCLAPYETYLREIRNNK